MLALNIINLQCHYRCGILVWCMRDNIKRGSRRLQVPNMQLSTVNSGGYQKVIMDGTTDDNADDELPASTSQEEANTIETNEKEPLCELPV